jgi:hypothetical protein
MLLQGTHISNGIDGCDNPERRGNQGEKHAQRIDPERNTHPREDINQIEDHILSIQNEWNHGADDAEFGNGNEEGPEFPEVGSFVRSYNQKRPKEGDSYGQ